MQKVQTLANIAFKAPEIIKSYILITSKLKSDKVW